ncbi:MAG: tRNA pseudouridine synthase A, partial [Haliea sp.]
MRIALGLSYNGGAYEGWQSQLSGNTVQDKLEKALGKFADQPIRTLCAGRTDAGVHALMQVVHFDTALARELPSWVRGSNAFLPRTQDGSSRARAVSKCTTCISACTP